MEKNNFLSIPLKMCSLMKKKEDNISSTKKTDTLQLVPLGTALYCFYNRQNYGHTNRKVSFVTVRNLFVISEILMSPKRLRVQG